MTFDELYKKEMLDKHCLLRSKEWLGIKTYLLKDIINLSNSEIDPLKLEGILYGIRLIEKWDEEYQSILKGEQ